MADDATDDVGDSVDSDDVADSFAAAVPGDDADERATADDWGDSDDQADASDSEDDSYAGVFGAFPYAFWSSESYLFKSYALVGGFLALAVALLFGLSVVVLIGATAGAPGGSFSFSRAFFVFVGLTVVAPLLAPILFVARRHRRGVSSARYDATLAALGYVFVGSLFVALVITVPPGLQEAVTGPFAPLIEFLYGRPPLTGLVPPLAVAVLIVLAGRRAS
ncbi:hypothetical protein SAMN05216559_0719 [Halomicrobium zhouii]|uniref:DUF8056 domain-containing protein n=1 Tax=Halomicrobium zhouii TaxID=767519 RepID=A0A1I6KFH8_9EURY|nr:hypothetical protein [Halomicrobium zhouii]SFR89967.1 hypothetical protein SAMN05216559_0719 [Halomicrobium zhouii]